MSNSSLILGQNYPLWPRKKVRFAGLLSFVSFSYSFIFSVLVALLGLCGTILFSRHSSEKESRRSGSSGGNGLTLVAWVHGTSANL